MTVVVKEEWPSCCCRWLISIPASSDHRLKLCLNRCRVFLFRCLTLPDLVSWSPAFSAASLSNLWICLVEIWPLSLPSKTILLHAPEDGPLWPLGPAWAGWRCAATALPVHDVQVSSWAIQVLDLQGGHLRDT